MSKTNEKSTIELAVEYLISQDEYYEGIDLCGKFRESAQEITETFGGNEDDSMSLYEFIESFYETYMAFRKEYEKLGVLNPGKRTTIDFCDYIDSDNYKFFSAKILRDCHLYERRTKTTDFLVPNRRYKYFTITEKDGVVSGQLLGSLGADSAWCPIDLDSNLLKAYLDLFGKHHQLLALSKYPGVVIESENASVNFDFFKDFSSIEGISGANVEVNCGECDMRICIRFFENEAVFYCGNAHYEDRTVCERIPKGKLSDEMLHSIRISRSYLNGYKGVAEKNLIKRSSAI